MRTVSHYLSKYFFYFYLLICPGGDVSIPYLTAVLYPPGFWPPWNVSTLSQTSSAALRWGHLSSDKSFSLGLLCLSLPPLSRTRRQYPIVGVHCMSKEVQLSFFIIFIIFFCSIALQNHLITHSVRPRYLHNLSNIFLPPEFSSQ